MIETRKISVKDFIADEQLRKMFIRGARDANERNLIDFNWTEFPIEYLDHHYANVAFKNGKPVGFLLATITPFLFDRRKRMIRQELLWVDQEQSYGVAKRLLEDFIDFGRRNVDHIFTMRTRMTNLKPSAFERLGFKELETLYFMEVKNEFSG